MKEKRLITTIDRRSEELYGLEIVGNCVDIARVLTTLIYEDDGITYQEHVLDIRDEYTTTQEVSDISAAVKLAFETLERLIKEDTSKHGEFTIFICGRTVYGTKGVK